MVDEAISRANEQKQAMKTERSSFEPHWREISDFISPRTSRYLREDRNRGEKYNKKIINEVAMTSHRTLESGMMAGMSSPARPWFGLLPPDPEMKKYAPAMEWLDIVTKSMLEEFAKSNIYSVLPKTYSNIGGYGTSAFALVEDEKDTFRAYHFPLGSYYLDSNYRQVVDRCYREFSMTVRQIVEMFGRVTASGGFDKSNISRHVQDAWDKGDYGIWIPVTHVIEPNPDHDPRSIHTRDKKYRSMYYEDSESVALQKRGYDSFPIISSRWQVNGEDVYGSRCPGMDALGSVKAVQLAERRKYQVMDKIWNPPMNADATLRNVGADLLPGGLNWIPGMAQNGNPGLRPAQDIRPEAVTVLAQDIMEVSQRIRSTFYADLMLMLATSENSNMTAREIEERHSEKLLVLGPMLEQQNDDTFDPLIDRTFTMMLQQGKFPPPPPELQGVTLRVEYISTMAQAQKLIGITALERFAGFVGNIAQYNPEYLDKFDGDAAIDDYGIMTGVTSNIVRPDDVVIEMRNNRAKQLAAKEQAERMPALVQGAQAAKTMAEIPTDGDNALTAMLSQMQGM